MSSHKGFSINNIRCDFEDERFGRLGRGVGSGEEKKFEMPFEM